MEKFSTKEPPSSYNKPQVINNQFYGANTDDDNSLYDDSKFEVSNDAVMVSSPAYSETVSSSYQPTDAATKSSQYAASQSFSTELPTRIYTSTAASSSSEESNEISNGIQFSKMPYDHSDIAYSPSDSEVLMEDGSSGNLVSQYPMSTAEPFDSETRTEATEKNKFSKPIFKLKPTSYPVSTEKYVLVHTISNDKQGNHEMPPTKKPSTNESIQSILLMLNGSNPGPEYNVDSMSVHNNYGAPSTPSYASTSMINREKYGSSSYYITTKAPTSPKVPSSSYVYSSATRRPSPTKTTTLTTRVKVTATKSPQTVTTLNVPSTSYVYSPNPIKKRPSTAATSSSTASPTTTTTTASKKGTTKRQPPSRPSIIVKRPTPEDENNYVVISGGGLTKHPSPTVHITPKPVVNILTTSTMDQLNNKKTPEQAFTPSSQFHSTTPATYVSSSIYVPAIQDFHNEGYFVVTHRPGAGVSSTTVYTVNSGIVNAHPDIKVQLPEHDPVNFNDIVKPPMSNDDFSNFPPVRNPNLNMTAGNNPVMDESDISTPSFIEDEQLNGKIDLLVNKLVASMQGNLDNLLDIVYERKNITTAEQDISNLKKNGTLTDAKPTKPAKTTPGSKVTTAKTPTRVTTGRPSQQTTKKAPTKASSATTKKPATATKKPSTGGQTSRKPPSRVTTTVGTTRKPTRRVTTSTTTERAPAEDEIIEEEGEETAEESENEDENVVEESEGDSTPAPLENGRIRKRLSTH